MSPSELKKLKNKRRKAQKKLEKEKEKQKQEQEKKEHTGGKKPQEQELDGPKEEDLIPEKLAKVRLNSLAYFKYLSALLLIIVILTLNTLSGVVGWCKGGVYFTSLGRPTDIGLHLGKACYTCSR